LVLFWHRMHTITTIGISPTRGFRRTQGFSCRERSCRGIFLKASWPVRSVVKSRDGVGIRIGRPPGLVAKISSSKKGSSLFLMGQRDFPGLIYTRGQSPPHPSR